MGKVPDVIVVGGGVIGCAVAYELARRSVPVLLVDKSLPGRATGRAGAPDRSGEGVTGMNGDREGLRGAGADGLRRIRADGLVSIPRRGDLIRDERRAEDN